MALALWSSLKKSLYRYKNLMLLSGLCFVGGFLLCEIFSARKTNGGETDKWQTLLQYPRTFTSFALWVLVLMAALLCVSNIALIRHEGFRPKNVLGIVLSACYIGGTYAISLLDAYLDLNEAILLFLHLLLSYMECFLASTAIMGLLAAMQKPKYDKDFIIIPGCAISKKGGLLPLLKGRTDRAIRYAWAQEIASGRPVKYVPSGGQGPDEVMSEGSAMELYLLSHGAEPDEVYPEKKSVSTCENFKFAKKIIYAVNPEANVAFATTNYHMLRSGILAYDLGMDAEGISSKTRWYFWPNGFVREFIAILAMRRKTHLAVVGALAVLCILYACL